MQADVWGGKNFANELHTSFAGFCGADRCPVFCCGGAGENECGSRCHRVRETPVRRGAICASRREIGRASCRERVSFADVGAARKHKLEKWSLAWTTRAPRTDDHYDDGHDCG